MYGYSEDGNHFLGVRKTHFGKTQMVYNIGGVEHHVYDIESANPSHKIISQAMATALKSKRVFPTLLATLAKSNISLRESI